MFVIDMAGFEGRDPVSELEVLRREVREYDKDLAGYPWLVAANKMDIEGAEEKLAVFRARFPKVEVFPISAETGEGLDALRRMLDEKCGRKGGGV
jgi:GTP-binding protein